MPINNDPYYLSPSEERTFHIIESRRNNDLKLVRIALTDLYTMISDFKEIKSGLVLENSVDSFTSIENDYLKYAKLDLEFLAKNLTAVISKSDIQEELEDMKNKAADFMVKSKD